MQNIKISKNKYYCSVFASKRKSYDLYGFCSSDPIKLNYPRETLKEKGIAFFFEYLNSYIATKAVYNKIMQCLDNLNLVNDIYDSWVWITVIDNIVIFTVNGAKIPNPILLEEKETQKLNHFDVEAFLNSRRFIFSEINKKNNKNTVNDIPAMGDRAIINKNMLDVVSVNYTYVVTGVTLKHNNPDCTSIQPIVYSIYLNNFVFPEDIILQISNKLKTIPCDKLLNIEDFFIKNVNELEQILKTVKANEITLFKNKFIIYSSMVKPNYNKLALKLNKYNILKN